MKKTLLITSTALGLLTSSNAAIVVGDIIGIDLGPTAATNGYNSITTLNGSLASVTSLSGAAIAGVSVATSAWSFSNNDTDETLGAGTIGSDASNLTDWFISLGGGANVTFSGLDDSLTYNITAGHAYTNNTDDTDTIYTVDGQTALSSHDGVSGDNYVTFTGLSTDGAGNLVIAANGVYGLTGLSALSLTAVPEPSSSALLGLGGLALILRRRK